MLHSRLTPSDFYARVDLEARIEGSSGRELTRICFDALESALSLAAHAAQRSNRGEAVRALARAATVLGGLQRAVDLKAEMGDVLAEFYASISHRLGELIRNPVAMEITSLRKDVSDVAGVFSSTEQASAP